MESNTEAEAGQTEGKSGGILLDKWEAIVQALPQDFAESAIQYKALERRRGIHSAEDLLRLALGYSVLDKSLNELGSWATAQGIAKISAPALYMRLCAAHEWVGRILFQFLEANHLHWPTRQAVQVDIRDATVISRPGSQGTDWRIHLSLDLGGMCIRRVELTDAKGGESLLHFPAASSGIVLGDRIYANRKGLISLFQVGAGFVIRATWQNLPLEDEQQRPWQVADWLERAFTDSQAVFQEQTLYLNSPQQRYALRICALRLPKEMAELAVQRARKHAQKDGHTPDRRTLFAAQFVFVVTNLSAQTWSTAQVLELYRVRWQVELFFKRLKSILFLDHLRAKKAELAQTYLLTKLLAACLLETLSHYFVQSLPVGWITLSRPLSYWTLTSLLWELFQSLIRGPLVPAQYLAQLLNFQRFLCSPPRKRKQQLSIFHSRLVSMPLPASLPPSGALS